MGEGRNSGIREMRGGRESGGKWEMRGGSGGGGDRTSEHVNKLNILPRFLFMV